jgi:tetratricopeptide (TPR) repeat protein
MKILLRFGLLLSILAPIQSVAAQFGGLPPPPPIQPQTRQLKDQMPTAERSLTTIAPPTMEPEEAKAYKAFFDIKPDAVDQQIQAGEQFVQKYPTGQYTEPVYAHLVAAYYQKQELDKMYAAADKALALNPDDVAVLSLVGWVIPHHYDSDDPESDKLLAKAAGYEKHVLEILATMPKPANMTDDQFAKAKATTTAQANSGLGLVYFRQEDWKNSVSQMQKATDGDPNPDPVDLYILGMGLSKLNRYGEAADSFQKCSQMPGGMQDRCKQKAAEAKTHTTSQPVPPK